jgi:heat shock protein HtpX
MLRRVLCLSGTLPHCVLTPNSDSLAIMNCSLGDSMLRTQGLLTYARNTQLKIVVMLLCYILVGLLIAAAISLTLAIGFAPGTLSIKLDSAWRLFVEEWDRILLGGLLWTFIATAMFRRRVERNLEGTAVDRATESRLYNIVENLAISSGLPVPQINIVESAATNALITGFSPKHMSLTFTRGALRSLNDRQLSAVVAHQLTLVLSGEARKLSLASTLTGISILAATWLVKPFYKFSFRTLLIILALPIFPYAMAGALVTSAVAAILGAVLLKLSVSKLRIYVCDAGALELTKDAEALVSAIQTMSIRSVVENADIALQPLLFVGANGGWLDTHPHTDARVAAIQSYVPLTHVVAAPLRLAVLQDQPSLRDSFAIPKWVTGSACSIPLGLFAAYCALTSQWSAVDRKAVQALRDDVQVVMEFSIEMTPAPYAKLLMAQAHLYKWAYGLELDIDALKKAWSASRQTAATLSQNSFLAPQKPMREVTGFTVSDSDPTKQYFNSALQRNLMARSYRKDQAHLIAAALKDRSKLAKTLYDAAEHCVLKHEDSEISRKVAQYWAHGFAAVASSETFERFKRFPLELEIDAIFTHAQDDQLGSDASHKLAQNENELIPRLSTKGLGTTWTPNSCVFQAARKSVESWVSVDDIVALGVRQEYIDQMKDGPALSPEDEKIIAADAENTRATMQMDELAKLVTGKSSNQRVAKAIERLKQAPWNQGYPPLSAVFFPALFMFLNWKLFRGVKWLLSQGVRVIRG